VELTVIVTVTANICHSIRAHWCTAYHWLLNGVPGTINLTLILLTWRIWWGPNNASKWQMGFNSPFIVLISLFLENETSSGNSQQSTEQNKTLNFLTFQFNNIRCLISSKNTISHPNIRFQRHRKHTRGFHHDINENSSFLGYYAGCSGNSLPMFRDHLLVAYWRIKNLFMPFSAIENRRLALFREKFCLLKELYKTL